ncbi:DUF2075 domain-containing protein [Planomonospora sp. ID91781]|uniref:DUF2075 domain-containing protein n=1 Tax=Planomonospora sp. ID91781 TaxID=2738135 RepID=UPI0027DB31F5|nr:DUF2075 domain-containing protein [Planomonospora sp. ID91781]
MAHLVDQVRGPTKAEQTSWKNSLPRLAEDLVEAGLGQVEMLIESQFLDLSRADVVLAGIDHDGRDTYVAVELKRWRSAKLCDDDPDHVRVPNLKSNPKHPLVQVRGYCDRLISLAGPLHGEADRIGGVAYLHNAEESAVIDLFHLAVDEHTRIFTQSTRGAFIEYLRIRFSPKPGKDAADRLLKGSEGPAKPLMLYASDVVKKRDHFVLSTEQQVAYNQVMNAVEDARRARLRRVVVVTGGPGSGKSAVALQLLSDLGARGITASIATGSQSFTQSLRRFAGGGNGRPQQLFQYFNSFVEDKGPRQTVLLCDEAHRLRATSRLHFSQKHLETGRPQIEELVNAAYVPVFLLDEHQVVRPDEIGSLAAIRGYADAEGLAFTHVHLSEQFRCGGSDLYDRWVRDLLGLPLNGPARTPGVWPGDKRFGVTLAGTPAEMEAILHEKMRMGYSARISAGFCWPWSKPVDGRLVPDIRINGWERPWNVKGERKVGNAPTQSYWALAEGGFDQVGCIYTAQGFEFDWAGVIIGPDLVARSGRLRTERNGNCDPKVSARSVDDPKFDLLVRNTYKVLLTRGLAGVVIYAVDDETREFLATLIK